MLWNVVTRRLVTLSFTFRGGFARSKEEPRLASFGAELARSKRRDRM